MNLSRRSFLQITAMAAAVAALPSVLTASTPIHEGEYALFRFRKTVLAHRLPRDARLRRLGDSYAEVVSQGVTAAEHVWIKVPLKASPLGGQQALGGAMLMYTADLILYCKDGGVTGIAKSQELGGLASITDTYVPAKLHHADMAYIDIKPLRFI